MRHLFRFPVVHLLLALALFSFALLSSDAQTFRGTLTGVVLDAQGAAIANASVQLTDPATGAVRSEKSNNVGEFDFPELPPGSYNLIVSFAGFKSTKIDGIDVAVSKVSNLKVELGVGTENT